MARPTLIEARLSLRVALIARLLRSRQDALAFALAELLRPTIDAKYARWLADFVLQYGGNAEQMIARAPLSMQATFRRAHAIPELVLHRLPPAEALYGLLARGYTTVPLPGAKPPKKSNLWMQLLEPAGQTPPVVTP